MNKSKGSGTDSAGFLDPMIKRSLSHKKKKSLGVSYQDSMNASQGSGRLSSHSTKKEAKLAQTRRSKSKQPTTPQNHGKGSILSWSVRGTQNLKPNVVVDDDDPFELNNYADDD